MSDSIKERALISLIEVQDGYIQQFEDDAAAELDFSIAVTRVLMDEWQNDVVLILKKLNIDDDVLIRWLPYVRESYDIDEEELERYLEATK